MTRHFGEILFIPPLLPPLLPPLFFWRLFGTCTNNFSHITHISRMHMINPLPLPHPFFFHSTELAQTTYTNTIHTNTNIPCTHVPHVRTPHAAHHASCSTQHTHMRARA